jgi:predicted phage terminase large subunit-like protein
MGKHEGRYYVIHLSKGQWSPYNRWKQLRALAERDQLIYGGRVQFWIEAEGGASGKDANLMHAQALDGFPVHFDNPAPRGSKERRADPWAGQLEAGNVVLGRNPARPWMMEIGGDVAYGPAVMASFIQNHLLFFPRGERCDDVDASSGAHSRLALPQPDRTGFTREAVARACRVQADLEPPLC